MFRRNMCIQPFIMTKSASGYCRLQGAEGRRREIVSVLEHEITQVVGTFERVKAMDS